MKIVPPFAVVPLVLLLGSNHTPEPCATLPSEHRFACDELRLYSRFKDLPEDNHNRQPLRYPHSVVMSTSTATVSFGDPIFPLGRPST